MIYYILLKGDSEFELTDANILGEVSFNKFYRHDGYFVLTNIVSNYPEIAETIQIKDQTGKSYSIDEFLSVVEQYLL